MTEKETFTRLIQLYAMNAGIDPDIAVRVARQESGITQQAVSPKGALGIMQLMPATARSLGVNPHDPAENIRGGVKYLKQMKDRFGGDTHMMLAGYNAGPGAVEKYGGVPPYKETRNYVQRIMGFLGPGSAEAATGTAPAPGTRPAVKAAKRLSPEERAALEARLAELEAAEGQERAALEARLAELEAARDREEGPTAPPPQPSPPSPPGAPAPEPLPPLAEQEEAATQQALSGTREGYEVEVQSGPPGTFGRQASGGASQLEPPETSPMARPPGVLPPGVPRPAAEPGPVAVQTTPEGRIDYEAYLPSPGKEAAQRAAAELINITSVGQGARLGLWAGSRFGPIPAAVGAGLGAVTGAVLSRTANVKTGLEEPGALGDWLSIAPPALQAGWGIAKGTAKAIVKSSRGWNVVKEAEDATKAAQKTYQEGVTKAADETAAAQKAYQEGVEAAEKATKAQRQAAITQEQARETAYQSRVQTQQSRAQTTHQAKEAQRAQAVADTQAEAVAEAQAKTQQQASDYAAQVQRYDQAKASQEQAVGEARAIPARYKPDTPAHVLYKKVAEIAPEAPVTLARTQEVAAELQDVLGQVPSLQPSRLQALLTDMRAARSTQSVKEVQRYLTDLGTLTRSNDSATRRTAKQLYGALHDDLAESASRLPETEAARDLLLQANATFRRELATRDLSRIIKMAIKVGDDGIPRLAPGQALTQFDRLTDPVSGDKLFTGSWTPDELTEMRGAMEALTTVQKIPTRPGAAPAPVQPRAVEPYTPTPAQPPTPPARPAPYSTWKPDVPPPTPPTPPEPPPKAPEPVVPKYTPSKGVTAQIAKNIVKVGVADFALGLPGPLTTIGLAVGAQQGIAELMAALVISPKTRPAMQYLLNLDGSINKKALVAMAGGRAALMAEYKKEQEKKTR